MFFFLPCPPRPGPGVESRGSFGSLRPESAFSPNKLVPRAMFIVFSLLMTKSPVRPSINTLLFMVLRRQIAGAPLLVPRPTEITFPFYHSVATPLIFPLSPPSSLLGSKQRWNCLGEPPGLSRFLLECHYNLQLSMIIYFRVQSSGLRVRKPPAQVTCPRR